MNFSQEERQVIEALYIANETLVKYRTGPNGFFVKIDASQIEFEAEQKSGDSRNAVRKQEPAINRAILSNEIMGGVRGNDGDSLLSNALRAAVILSDAYGLPLSGGESRKVDDEFLLDKFGPEMGKQIISDLAVIAGARDRLKRNENPAVAPRYASAMAAIEVANLRMAVRSVGDGAIRRRDATAGEAIPDFMKPESQNFVTAIEAAEKALNLPGVDQQAFKGARDILVADARKVAAGQMQPELLTDGPYRTVPNFQNGLPTVAPYQNGRYNSRETALEKAQRAIFEASRYHVHNRRKGSEEEAVPDIVHLLRTAAKDGTTRDADKIAGDVLHDVDEDRKWDFTKRDQIRARFGDVVGGRVSEVTDVPPTITAEQQFDMDNAAAALKKAYGTAQEAEMQRLLERAEAAPENAAKKHSVKNYQAKARLFGEIPLTQPLLSARDLFQDKGVEAIVPANPNIPFSIEGALLKMADFSQTMEGTIATNKANPSFFSDPKIIGQRSDSSGFQLGLQRDKESFIIPLMETIALRLSTQVGRDQFIEKGFDPKGLMQMVETYIDFSRTYLEVGLNKVAAERGLNADSTQALKDIFSGPGPNSPADLTARISVVLNGGDEVTDGDTALARVAQGYGAKFAINIANLARTGENFSRIRTVETLLAQARDQPQLDNYAAMTALDYVVSNAEGRKLAQGAAAAQISELQQSDTVLVASTNTGPNRLLGQLKVEAPVSKIDVKPPVEADLQPTVPQGEQAERWILSVAENHVVAFATAAAMAQEWMKHCIGDLHAPGAMQVVSATPGPNGPVQKQGLTPTLFGFNDDAVKNPQPASQPHLHPVGFSTHR